MQQITIRLPEEMIESLDDEADEHGRSRSEHIREVLASRTEHDELHTEIERLRREKRQILDQREEKNELARYVEEEQEWRSAPIWTRAKWWVAGKG
jgi:metal-responsive CopG/Arc/MetJ family transcriptional regulator